jgi:hypothetical protein
VPSNAYVDSGLLKSHNVQYLTAQIVFSDWSKGRTENTCVDLTKYVLIVLDHLVELED